MVAKNSSFVTLTGFKELEAALLKLPPELAKIAEADAVRYGMIPVRKAARNYAKRIKDTGQLQKSIGLNVRRIRKKGPNESRYTARVGPQAGYSIVLRESTSRKDKTGKLKSGRLFTYRKAGSKYQVIRDPRYYAHLVEYGTSKIAARPFIRPAVESSEDAIMAGLQNGYEKGMAKVIKKIRSNR